MLVFHCLFNLLALVGCFSYVWCPPQSPNLSPGSSTVQRYWLNTLPRNHWSRKTVPGLLCRPVLSEHKALSPWAPREPGRNHRHLQTSKTQQSLPNKQKPSRVMENANGKESEGGWATGRTRESAEMSWWFGGRLNAAILGEVKKNDTSEFSDLNINSKISNNKLEIKSEAKSNLWVVKYFSGMGTDRYR